MKGVAIFEIVMFHFFGDHGWTALKMYQAGGAQAGVDLWLKVESIFLQATRVGSQGIHVFFFMSGVGLAASGLRNQTAPGSFLWKRLSRIYPAFLLALLLVVLLQVTTGQSESWDNYWSAVAASVVLVRNYSFDWIRVINGNWWFVCALVPTYVLYLLMRRHFMHNPLFWGAGMFIASFSYKVVLAILMSQGLIAFDAGQLNPYTAFFLNYSWEFFAGVTFVIAGGWVWLEKQSVGKLLALSALGLGCQLFGIWLGMHEVGRIFNDDFFAVSQIVLLSCLYLFASRLNLSRFLALVGWVGVSSYGLYLVHHPISKTLVHYQWAPSGVAIVAVAFCIYFVICLTIGRGVDRAASRFSAR